MGAPLSLLKQARAFARDFPRDQMPQGYLWDVCDFVPLIVDAPLTGRGAWRWGSTVVDSDFDSGLLMPFTTGDQLLVASIGGTLYQVDLDPPYTAHPHGTSWGSAQNPVRYKNVAVQFEPSGSRPPLLWTSSGVSDSHPSFKNSPVGTVYKAMLVTGGAPGEENIVRFSHPNADLTAADAYDANSFIATSQKVTAIAAMRAVVLVFHAGSVERIRGSTPPHGDTDKGDMFLESLFDRAGCLDPKSIAYWNDNCVFADEHGVHITDGAVVRNLVSQGGILYYWRNVWNTKLSAVACTFLDYYIITLRRVGEDITLICDLNKKQWFRFSNLAAMTYIASGGSAGMERIWAGIGGQHRLARVGPCFFPTFDNTPITDDNGVVVLPFLETPWYRLAVEGRKRVRFVYLSYDARETAVSTTPLVEVGYITSPQQPAYVSAGQLPGTSEYTRFRLPVNKFPYGVGFRVRQTVPGTVFRVFDIGVEAQAVERSRV